MPQFDFAHVFLPQVFWLALLFSVLYFGVVRLTLPKLGKLVDAREGKISGDLAAAKAAKEDADGIAESYLIELNSARDAARQALNDAKLAAAKASESKLSAAQTAVDTKLAAAEGRIASAVAEARQALQDVAAENAQAIVVRLTGKEPTLQDARAQVAGLGA